jgi:hypothetical protein
MDAYRFNPYAAPGRTSVRLTRAGHRAILLADAARWTDATVTAKDLLRLVLDLALPTEARC